MKKCNHEISSGINVPKNSFYVLKFSHHHISVSKLSLLALNAIFALHRVVVAVEKVWHCPPYAYIDCDKATCIVSNWGIEIRA